MIGFMYPTTKYADVFCFRVLSVYLLQSALHFLVCFEGHVRDARCNVSTRSKVECSQKMQEHLSSITERHLGRIGCQIWGILYRHFPSAHTSRSALDKVARE